MNTFSKYWEKAIFFLRNRFVLFGTYFVIFIGFHWVFTGAPVPSPETKDIWFYSGIIMVLFSVLFIEPYYTSPKNVITNTIPLLLVLLSIKSTLPNQVLWWSAEIFLLTLLISSILAVAIEDKNKSDDHFVNKLSVGIKDFVVCVGQGKYLYSVFFVYFLLTYYSIQNIYTVINFLLWGAIVVVNPKNIHNNFSVKTIIPSENQIGEIFGVQSKKIFLAKLFEDRRSIREFDIVEFCYSMQDTDDLTITGIVFDTYLLNQEKWAKVLQLSKPEKQKSKLEKNVVYKITDSQQVAEISKALRVDEFVGVIIDGSTIGKIKFEYSKKKDDLQEGDLLELKVGTRRLFYQVIFGVTKKEKLEARNETGFIEGDAIQLGEWQPEQISFQKFGWVPVINTPLFKANTSDIKVEKFSYPNYQLGKIPNTTLPSVINLDEAVRCHLALLGITGSGKSFLAKEIIEKLLIDTRVICIDFTGEWKKDFDSQKYTLIKKETIDSYLSCSENKIAIFELPTLSNTTDVLKETQSSLEKIFGYAKSNYDNNTPLKIALVLEEAHTITPETSFLGDMGDYSTNKALVNKMTQIALQGRKYGVGLIVIAQRTANVSKTVLTQCNTVICFQAFDETSFSFLGNYIGKEMVQALPNLKQYHAVVAGKAIKSNTPMIVDLYRNGAE